MNAAEYILAIDYGTKRVGVAITHSAARLPRPLTTLLNTDALIDEIQDIASKEQVGTVVIGLPRGMDGGYTDQTRLTESFAKEIHAKLALPVFLVDETLTSVEAERGPIDKAGLDAQAASIILERYFSEASQEVTI